MINDVTPSPKGNCLNTKESRNTIPTPNNNNNNTNQSHKDNKHSHMSHHSNCFSGKKPPKPQIESLFIMNIEISKDNHKQLEVFLNKPPEETAFDFCKANNLTFNTMKDIINKIKRKTKEIMRSKHYSQSEDNLHFNSPKYHTKRNNDIVYNDTKMNYGEYLYTKGQEQQHKVKIKVDNIKKENEALKTLELTFKPKLYKNKPSSLLHHHNKQQKVSLHLSKENNIHNSTLQNTTTHQHKHKHNKRKAHTPQYTFRPHINKNYKVKSNFEERLIQSTHRTNNNNNANSNSNSSKLTYCGIGERDGNVIIKNEKLFDKCTGQILFHPKLVSKRKCNVDINSKNVFQINYDYAMKYKHNKEEMAVHNYHMWLNKGKEKSCNETDRIYNEKKIDSFKYIFELLDSDEDGKISAVYLNRKALGKNINEIISPIIEQIIQQRTVIEESDFIQAMEVLFNAIGMGDKMEILNIRKHHSK